jgi:hypothetical protein
MRARSDRALRYLPLKATSLGSLTGLAWSIHGTPGDTESVVFLCARPVGRLVQKRLIQSFDVDTHHG